MTLDKEIIVRYLEENTGKEMTAWQLVRDCYGNDKVKDMGAIEGIYLYNDLYKIAKDAGFRLDKSKYRDMVVGLPHNVPFVIRKKRVKKQRSNKYDAPFMNMDRETAEKVANQNSPAERRMIINGDDYYNRIVREIAEEEVNSMSDEDKEYYLEHSDYNEHHFGYGMYLRNNYIHGKIDVLSPDDMSGDIFEEIIKLLNK